MVSYSLGIILCFVCPTNDCECWKVYTFSISPRHNIGGNYIQYYNDDLMSKFITKEQSLGLVTQSLYRPITNTLITTLSRLHPTTMRKLFNSYPSSNPFMGELLLELGQMFKVGKVQQLTTRLQTQLAELQANSAHPQMLKRASL